MNINYIFEVLESQRLYMYFQHKGPIEATRVCRSFFGRGAVNVAASFHRECSIGPSEDSNPCKREEYVWTRPKYNIVKNVLL